MGVAAMAFSIFCFNRRLGYWFLGLAVLNSLARIFVGVHWPSDILGGFLAAVISILIVKKFLKQCPAKSV